MRNFQKGGSRLSENSSKIVLTISISFWLDIFMMNRVSSSSYPPTSIPYCENEIAKMELSLVHFLPQSGPNWDALDLVVHRVNSLVGNRCGRENSSGNYSRQPSIELRLKGQKARACYFHVSWPDLCGTWGETIKRAFGTSIDGLDVSAAKKYTADLAVYGNVASRRNNVLVGHASYSLPGPDSRTCMKNGCVRKQRCALTDRWVYLLDFKLCTNRWRRSIIFVCKNLSYENRASSLPAWKNHSAGDSLNLPISARDRFLAVAPRWCWDRIRYPSRVKIVARLIQHLHRFLATSFACIHVEQTIFNWSTLSYLVHIFINN